ncbi:hypothetical protein KIW84_036165 [Lathyrus oleraceus]|uniref:DNA2/NAM7 helicase helicase domain-containing protein n=1 Tax=Pisum sativum TaxID=3888 RepID=A0A9D4Y5R9_PEA|nr:hypothetical protein KIW84_036165 [Pisum sativum]
MSGVYNAETGSLVVPLFKPWMERFSSMLEIPVQSENPDDWSIRMEALKCLNQFIQNFSSLIKSEFEAVWDDLCCDLTASLSKLLDVSDNTFWRTGWVHFRLQHQMAFIFNGQGNYLVCEDAHESTDQYSKELDELQCIQFSCSVPVTNERGFIEIEDQGLSSSFFPFIVAEEDVFSEIRVLEPLLELSETDPDIEGSGKIKAKSQARDFIHEMGWLLHRSQLKYRIGKKKLLNVLLDETVNKGNHLTLYQALTEMGLLHKAVRRNSKAVSRVCSERMLRSKFRGPFEHALFDAVVIDEVAQALESATLIPLQLLKSNGTQSCLDFYKRGGHPVIILTEQYRMRPKICKFPSSHFYDNKLLNGSQMSSKSAPCHQTEGLGPYAFYDVVDSREAHEETLVQCRFVMNVKLMLRLKY